MSPQLALVPNHVYYESNLGGAGFAVALVYLFGDYIETCASFNFYRTTSGTGAANGMCNGVAFALDFHKNLHMLGKDVSDVIATHGEYTNVASLIYS